MSFNLGKIGFPGALLVAALVAGCSSSGSQETAAIAPPDSQGAIAAPEALAMPSVASLSCDDLKLELASYTAAKVPQKLSQFGQSKYTPTSEESAKFTRYVEVNQANKARCGSIKQVTKDKKKSTELDQKNDAVATTEALKKKKKPIVATTTTDGATAGKGAAQEEVRARHILVKSKADAEEIVARLRGGSSFAALAKAKSTDTRSGANGGDLGYFHRGQMVQPFEDAAFAMKPGDISAPVESQYGWHVIKLEDKRNMRSTTLAVGAKAVDATPDVEPAKKDATKKEIVADAGTVVKKKKKKLIETSSEAVEAKAPEAQAAEASPAVDGVTVTVDPEQN